MSWVEEVDAQVEKWHKQEQEAIARAEPPFAAAAPTRPPRPVVLRTERPRIISAVLIGVDVYEDSPENRLQGCCVDQRGRSRNDVRGWLGFLLSHGVTFDHIVLFLDEQARKSVVLAALEAFVRAWDEREADSGVADYDVQQAQHEAVHAARAALAETGWRP